MCKGFSGGGGVGVTGFVFNTAGFMSHVAANFLVIVYDSVL